MKTPLLSHTVFENIADSNGIFSKHFHDTYTIGLTHDGLFKSIHTNHTALAYKYSTRIINPGEVHCGDSKSWQYTNFYPSVELVSQVYEQMYGFYTMPIFQKHIIEDEVLYKMLVDFFHAVYTQEDELSVESRLIGTLSYMIKHYAVASKEVFTCKNHTATSRVLDFIHHNLEREISLEEMSQQSGLSKYHFLRLFAETLGVTPHQYIIAQRIQKAKQFVLEGETLSLAGVRAGFSDQSHFIRSFRKIYGYSPKTLLQKSNFILYS